MTKETILVFSAHTDDFVLGAGGTIANYIKQGKKVIAVVFSLGESSHPWLKANVVKKMRADETFDSIKILNCKIMFNDLKELHFMSHKDIIIPKLIKLINKEKPSKIFTHSSEDPHPDHKSVNKITLEVLNQTHHEPELYIYSVWNPVSIKTQYPALYSDISKTFTTKLRALKSFKSQKIHISYPLFILIFKNIIDGIKIRKWFAEKFFRIK